MENPVQVVHNYLNIMNELRSEIEEISKVYKPTEEMEDKWEKCHNRFVEKTAWIKQMLTL